MDFVEGLGNVVGCMWGFCCVMEVCSENIFCTRLVRREVRIKCLKCSAMSGGWFAQLYVWGVGW